MSMIKKVTSKNVIYVFDGYSEYYGALVQGAFAGRFVVPKQHAHLVRDGDEIESLLSMYNARRYGVTLFDAHRVQ